MSKARRDDRLYRSLAERDPVHDPRFNHEIPIEPVPDWFYAFATTFDLVGWVAMPTPGWPFRYARGADPRNSRLLAVITGFELEHGCGHWLHVSYSRPTRVPSYDDLVLVKRCFIGAERKAISVHPPESEHVNLHPYCLHLWHALDGDGLPDFRSHV